MDDGMRKAHVHYSGCSDKFFNSYAKELHSHICRVKLFLKQCSDRFGSTPMLKKNSCMAICMFVFNY